MPLTNAGREFLTGRVIGIGSTPFNALNARIGVGNSNISFNSSQTDLIGTLKARLPMDEGFPKVDPEDPSTIIFRSTFDENTANFSWEEWGVFNDSTGGTMLVRVVDSVGLKDSGSIWVFTAYIKFQS